MGQLLRVTAQKGKDLLHHIGRGIYPPLCLSCSGETDTAGLCADCWRDTKFITGHACNCCGTPLLGDPDDVPCDDCLRQPQAWSHGRAVAVYSGGARRIALALKHGDRLDMGPTIGRWMVVAGHDILQHVDIIAPVPLHWTRLLKRRYNQAVELSRHIAVASDNHHVPDLLTRFKPTSMQQDMTRAERFENQREALKVTDRFVNLVQGKRILLVDDVMTTGATLSACAEACISAGAANVNVLVFARVARPL
jgi:ComF family protein